MDWVLRRYNQYMEKDINFFKLRSSSSSYMWFKVQAIENNRLFILDYHDLLLPFIKSINSLKGRKAYASRTILFFTNTGNIRPIAIELSLPPTPSAPLRKRVYTRGHDATSFWIWKLAKAHVCSNDAGVHQLVNHWWVHSLPIHHSLMFTNHNIYYYSVELLL